MMGQSPAIVKLRDQSRNCKVVSCRTWLDLIDQLAAQFRITTQLIDVETGFRIWSDAFDRELRDVFAIAPLVIWTMCLSCPPHLGHCCLALSTSAPAWTPRKSFFGYPDWAGGLWAEMLMVMKS